MNEVKDQLIKLMEEVMPERDFSQVSFTDRLVEDIGINSLNLMLTAIMIEDHFHFTFDSGYEAKTLGDLCQYIIDKTSQTGNSVKE